MTERKPAVTAAMADLQLDASMEAAHIASVAARHFVENIGIGDLPAAEHSMDVAIRHLNAAAATYRAWQAMTAEGSDREAAE